MFAVFFFNDTATTEIYTLSLQRRSSDLVCDLDRCHDGSREVLETATGSGETQHSDCLPPRRHLARSMREAPGTRARRRRGSTGRLRGPVTNSNRRVRSPTAHEVRRVVCAAVPRVDGLLGVRAEWALHRDALPRIVVHVLRGDDL